MKRATALKIILSLAAFWILPLTVIGCNTNGFLPVPVLEPHYLLTGDKTADEDLNFVYYRYTKVEDDSETGYAIGLTEYGKSNSDLPAIPTKYTDGKTPISAIWHNGFHGAVDTTIELTGDNIKYIDFEAFLYSAIESFVIPNSVEKIGDGAFYACPNLKSLYFGTPVGGNDECACDPSPMLPTPHVTVIPSFCFFKCSELTNITLPSKNARSVSAKTRL